MRIYQQRSSLQAGRRLSRIPAAVSTICMIPRDRPRRRAAGQTQDWPEFYGINAQMIYNLPMLDRRRFLRTSVSAAAASSIAAWSANTPVKIAHREGNMPKKPGASAYELASGIPGLSGLEVGSGTQLLDRASALAYKK